MIKQEARLPVRQAKERIEKLKKLIDRYRYEYHVLNKLPISEEALDSLKHELKKLEDEFPDLITPDSPTQRVAGKPLKEFKKVRHQSKMLSLEDVFSEKEFVEWAARLERVIKDSSKGRFYAEPKFDGLAISIVYKDGVLDYAATRGDGEVGENVTQNVRTIESVPLSISQKGRVEVRGEVIITKKNFELINKEQKKRGGKIYANSRNLAAGSIRQLDPKVTASRRLDFFAYDLIIGTSDVPMTSNVLKLHSEEHEALRDLGFKTGGDLEKLLKSAGEVFAQHKKIAKRREKLAYNIDGLVVSVDSNDLFKQLGVVGKAPRGAIAFKFSPKEATTKVEDIIVQVGRTGALTPVAVLKAVEIGGVTVSRATLHNEDEIKRLGLKIGDSVIVRRAGDVIPNIKKVLKELRAGHEKEFRIPKHCPVCKKPVEKLQKEGVGFYCVNKNCPAKHREGMYHFVSRKAFNIDGLGPKILDAFLDNGLIQDAADIFELREGDIAPLERFGEKSSENIVSAIKNSRKIPLSRFIYALGILHVGEETALLLAKQFPISNFQFLIKKYKSLSPDELQKIQDIGPKVAESIYNWFRDERNIAFLKKLEKAGIKLETPKLQVSSSKLRGKTFVFTGELKTMSRDEAKTKIRELGGDPSETVSKNTDYVVVGSEPGSKHEKAKKLGVKIINEKEFLELLTNK